MSPLEYIKKGICSGNWATVCEGYKKLTGEILPIPPQDIAEKVLREIAMITTNALVKSNLHHDVLPIIQKKRGRQKDNGQKRTTKAKKTTAEDEDSTIKLDENKRTVVSKELGGTRLITNNPDPEEVTKNKIKAAKASDNKAKLNRSTTQKHKAKCNECEKMFDSDRPSGKMGQKCPSCLREKKSRFS